MNQVNGLAGLAAAVAAAMPVLIPLGRFLYALFAQKFLPSNIRLALDDTAGLVVRGVEQGMAASTGPDKKKAATTAVNAILDHYHIKVPGVMVDMIIEDAVLALKNNGQEADATPADQPSSIGFSYSSAPTSKG